MLLIKRQPMQTIADLMGALQNAIMLEHSTLPPYLAAYYTLSGESSSLDYARSIIRDIVIEEMLHMTIAANILNAIGGSPKLNAPEFIPHYPGPLPMGIGDDDGDAPGQPLIVGLKRYSKDLVRDVFMAIEAPEDPHEIKTMDLARRVTPLSADAEAEEPKFQTIGQFYTAVREKIEAEGAALFEDADPSKQVTIGFSPEEIFPITNVGTAIHAIEIIVEQGEGTPQQPIDFEGDVPHYYRYQSLVEGKEAVQVPFTTDPLGVVFDSNKPISIDETTEVIQMVDNPQLVDLSAPEHTQARRLSDECDAIYSKLLNGLHVAFNGSPSKVGEAIGVMYELKNIAEELLTQQLVVGPNAGQFAGPGFRYVP